MFDTFFPLGLIQANNRLWMNEHCDMFPESPSAQLTQLVQLMFGVFSVKTPSGCDKTATTAATDYNCL